MEKENRLKLAIALSLVFMTIEVIGGYLSNSIAIFSDAAHLLTDIAGFVISLIAAIAAKRQGTMELTYGLARVEVLAALCSVVSLWLITFVLLYEAFLRAVRWCKGYPEEVNGLLMFAIAVFGVLVNLCLGWIFHQDHGGDLHPGHSHSHDHGHCSHNPPKGIPNDKSKQKYEALGMDSVHDVGMHAGTKIDSAKLSTRTADSTSDSSSDRSDQENGLASTTKASPGYGGCCDENGGCCMGDIELQLQQAMYCSTDIRSFLPSASLNAGNSLQDKRRRRLEASSSSKSISQRLSSRSGKTSTVAVFENTTTEREIASVIDKESCDVTISALHDVSNSISDDLSSNSNAVFSPIGCSHDHDHSHDHSQHSVEATESVYENGGGDVNLEAAYLHVLTDLIQSIGVALAGLLIFLMPHWQIIDPLCTFAFSFLALYSTIPLLKKIVRILLEGTPSHVSQSTLSCLLVVCLICCS